MREAAAAVAEARSGSRTVELTPRPGYLRRVQHELVERSGLSSTSRGDEPFRHLVVFP